jgi:hypothetical protein
MTKQRSQLFLCLAFLLFSDSQLPAQDHRAQLKTEAGGGWGALKEGTTRSYSVTATMVDEDSISKTPKRVTFLVKQNRDSYLFEIITPSGVKGDRAQEREVQATNSRYSFIAKNHGSGWVLTTFNESPDSSGSIRQKAKQLGYNYLDSAWGVGGHSFPEVLDNPGFKLIQFLNVGADTGGPAQLVFSVPPPANPRLALQVGIEKGTVEFDRCNNWRINKAEFQMPASMSGGVISSTIQYRTQDGLIARYEQKSSFGAKFQNTVVFTTDSVEIRDVPESEFSLSAYGLPEPAGVTWEKTKTPTPMYQWLLLAGGILALISVLCRWWLRRRLRAKQG